jgi:diazepam-binding inhibitor (GABA receptor modulating acyl-CoA-binding protein)
LAENLFLTMSDFDKAVHAVRTLPPTSSITDDDRLLFYSLYKQATVGNINTSRPSGWMDFEAKAKWDAWERRKGMSRENAKQAYVAQLDRLLAGWRQQ